MRSGRRPREELCEVTEGLNFVIFLLNIYIYVGCWPEVRIQV